MELAQAINPSIKNNEEELLSYYEALQEQIISEMKQIEEKRKIEILRDKHQEDLIDGRTFFSKMSEELNKGSNNQSSEDQTIEVIDDESNQAPEEPDYVSTDDIQNNELSTDINTNTLDSTSEEYIEGVVNSLAKQIIEKGSFTTLSPVPQEILDRVYERVQQLQQPEKTRARFFQNAVEKLKNIGVIKNISIAEKKLLGFLSKRENKKTQEHQETLISSDDNNYIDVLARQLNATGEIRTPFELTNEQKHMIEERARAMALDRTTPKTIDRTPISVNPTPEEALYNTTVEPIPHPVTPDDNGINVTTISPITPPNVVTPIGTRYEREELTPPDVPTNTPMPRTTVSQNEPVKINEEEILNQDYIEEMANLMLENGTITTFAPIPEKYGIAIAKRVEELKKQRTQASEFDEMFNNEEVVEETTLKK